MQPGTTEAGCFADSVRSGVICRVKIYTMCTTASEARLRAGSERGEGAALERGVADALARAVGASGAPAAVWGLLADFHSATGSRVSEREALLKQVHHVDDETGGMHRTRIAQCDEQAHCSACCHCSVHAKAGLVPCRCVRCRAAAGRQTRSASAHTQALPWPWPLLR